MDGKGDGSGGRGEGEGRESEGGRLGEYNGHQDPSGDHRHYFGWLLSFHTSFKLARLLDTQ